MNFIHICITTQFLIMTKYPNAARSFKNPKIYIGLCIDMYRQI